MDTTIIEQLYALVYTHPFYGGEAVYWARAILHIDVIDEMPQLRKGRPNIQNQNVLKLQNGKLLPNPAKDYVLFNYEKNKSDKISLEIIDCIGKKKLMRLKLKMHKR
ncbi:MAG: hypothetical protein IPO27_12515 [Bacteroidetes bacterium]|nr:hypothetical protein [Bacteroidota bacterium]